MFWGRQMAIGSSDMPIQIYLVLEFYYSFRVIIAFRFEYTASHRFDSNTRQTRKSRYTYSSNLRK